jgi:hypothetical protein
MDTDLPAPIVTALVIDKTQSAPKETVPPAATATSKAASEHEVT